MNTSCKASADPYPCCTDGGICVVDGIQNIVMGLVIHTMNVKILIVKHRGSRLYGQVQEHVMPSMTTIRRLSMAWLSGSLIVKVLMRCMDPAT